MLLVLLSLPATKESNEPLVMVFADPNAALAKELELLPIPKVNDSDAEATPFLPPAKEFAPLAVLLLPIVVELSPDAVV